MQGFFGFRVVDCSVDQDDVDVQAPVPGRGIVPTDRIVVDSVILGGSDHIEAIGDPFEEQFLVLQRPETATT